jgi:hypothetical protein
LNDRDDLTTCLSFVSSHSQVCLGFVTGKILDRAQSRAILANERARFGGASLVGNSFEELPYPKATRIPGRLGRWQSMVGPDYLTDRVLNLSIDLSLFNGGYARFNYFSHDRFQGLRSVVRVCEI